MIITIGRQYGSGGHVIGQIIADKLNVPYYDKEILMMAAKNSGMSPEIMQHHDEKTHISQLLAGNILHGSMLHTNGVGNYSISINQRVFLAQAEIINQIAEEGSCVIVGRCADYILRERKDLFRVFFYSDEESCIKRIMNLEHCDEPHARELIRKVDKERKNYYNFFSDGNWGSHGKYDALIRTDGASMEEIAQAVILLAKSKTEK